MLESPPLNPQTFIACARTLLGLSRPAGASSNSFFDEMRSAASVPADESSDLALVHHIGWHSQRCQAGPWSGWPFSRTATHDELAERARALGLIVQQPAAGDVVLRWSVSHRRYNQAAIVERQGWRSTDAHGQRVYHCAAIGVVEGSPIAFVSDHASSAGGEWVERREVAICPDRGDVLIRWALHDTRQATIDARDITPAPATPPSWDFEELFGRAA